MKTVVLAEKPSVARDIAKVLKCHKKLKGAFEGDAYIVTWALGHLVTLADPESYNPAYAQWRMEDLPMLPKPLKLEVIKGTRHQYNCVRTQLLRNDVGSVVIATDAGREGELVARWIIEKTKLKKPIKRLWISSVTDKAIADGFKKLRDGQAYVPLYHSAIARAAADWYVGMNATRALTCRYNAQLSCGRVQTPTLAMIANRESEIRSFQSKTYYGLQLNMAGIVFEWQPEKGQNRDKASIETLRKTLEKERPVVGKGTVKTKKHHAPGLYDLTELQREANSRYSFSAKQTLNIMQRLYEHHKVLTYPRTDSRFLSKDIVPTLNERLRAIDVQPYAKIAGGILRNGFKANSAFVDDNKVSDHHAIIPTEATCFIQDFDREERLIYEMVVKRFLAVLMPPHTFEQTTYETKLGTATFVAKSTRTLSQGWQVLEGESAPEVVSEPTFDPERFKLNVTEHTTTPPAYHTEGTLLAMMEKPYKGAEYGIGTVATRADIIEKLLNNFLIEKKGNSLYMTSKGRQLLEIVPDDLKSPKLTAAWEQKLEKIAKNALSKEAFIDEMMGYTKHVLRLIKNSEATFKHDNITKEPCPTCGKMLLEVNGKKGKMRVCQDRECGYKKRLEVLTNARCPNCHKKMVMKGDGSDKRFFCACGYKEKLEAFNKRKKSSADKGSKHDLEKFLKEQNAAIEVESPFAALSNLNLKKKK